MSGFAVLPQNLKMKEDDIFDIMSNPGKGLIILALFMVLVVYTLNTESQLF